VLHLAPLGFKLGKETVVLLVLARGYGSEAYLARSML